MINSIHELKAINSTLEIKIKRKLETFQLKYFKVRYIILPESIITIFPIPSYKPELEMVIDYCQSPDVAYYNQKHDILVFNEYAKELLLISDFDRKLQALCNNSFSSHDELVLCPLFKF